MNWYYASGAEQKGPVTEEELVRLEGAGVVTAETLVWRDGLPNWQRRGSVLPGPSADPSAGETVCLACGRRTPAREVFTLGEASYCAACKPQVLQSIKEGKPLTNAAAEETRNLYLKHEASVKSIGVLYYIGGVALICAGIAVFIAGLAGDSGVGSIIGSVLLLALGGGQIWVATGLRRLQAWARIPTAILAALGLLGFPIGTIINGYILYLICSQKGATVFSPEYQEVMRQTPHIKYRTSLVVWIFLGLIVLLVLFGIGAAVLSKH